MRTGILLGLICWGLSICAQTPIIVGQNQKFIYQNEHTGFVLIETLQPGMNLYRLSLQYNISIASILAVNPDLDPNAIPLNFPINIPIEVSSITFQAPPGEGEHIWLCYRVQPKETLYRISKVYLNTSPETITALNPASQTGLSIGQVLHIGWYTPGESVHLAETISGIKPDTLAGTPKDFIK
ncbi:MAG: LysM peptidoglycan-binding domain-containing protein, partial [Bacteroidota bacterium]|nr:LysM peptidoglycan-binding domain-containing protein [Bacteroidota bacterium]